MEIEKRFEKLEKELQRSKRKECWFVGFGSLMLCFFSALFLETTASNLTAQKPSVGKEIRANNFILEDADGRIRARLNLSGDDQKIFDLILHFLIFDLTHQITL